MVMPAYCGNGHEFTEENTRWATPKGRSPRRHCRICDRGYVKKYKSHKQQHDPEIVDALIRGDWVEVCRERDIRDAITVLLKRGDQSAAAIARQLGCAPRTVERQLGRLREAGEMPPKRAPKPKPESKRIDPAVRMEEYRRLRNQGASNTFVAKVWKMDPCSVRRYVKTHLEAGL